MITIPSTPPADVVRAAVAAGAASPCDKSKRGAVVFDPATGYIVGGGFNGRPGDRAGTSCGGACRPHCRDVAVHAEQRAIRCAVQCFPQNLGRVGYHGNVLPGIFDLLHAKVVDGKLVAGGGPSCVACSKEALDANIAGVWLFEEAEPAPRWVRYDALTFHALSCAANGIEHQVAPGGSTVVPAGAVRLSFGGIEVAGFVEEPSDFVSDGASQLAQALADGISRDPAVVAGSVTVTLAGVSDVGGAIESGRVWTATDCANCGRPIGEHTERRVVRDGAGMLCPVKLAGSTVYRPSRPSP